MSTAPACKTKTLASQMPVKVARIKALAQVARQEKRTQVRKSENEMDYVQGNIESSYLVFIVVEEVRAKLAGVKNVVLVLSGKGGVGKSTVST